MPDKNVTVDTACVQGYESLAEVASIIRDFRIQYTRLNDNYVASQKRISELESELRNKEIDSKKTEETGKEKE